MARIGFCARLGRRIELQRLAIELGKHRHEVVSSWIWRDDRDEGMTDEQKADAARTNFNGLNRAEVIVLFGENPGTVGAERGGRFFDLGTQAYRANTVRRIVVGPRENVGCFWMTEHVHDAAELIELLKGKP
jgi:formylmethanofuran dehydrogenase subunit B